MSQAGGPTRRPSSVQRSESQYNNKLYDRIRVLGKGSFGTAIVHRRRADCSLVVLKEIDLSKFRSDGEISSAINEARIMSTLNHVNIIKYHNSYTTDTKLIIEMEYASLGTLLNYLSLRGAQPLDEQEILIILRQITSGLNYLHSKNIIHLDLKMTNIFVTIEGYIKIGDFGIAQFMAKDLGADRALDSARATSDNSAARSQGLVSTQLGTLAYSSPERCMGQPFDFKSDIWSLGCILYELITSRPLFSGESLPELVQSITRIQYVPIRRKLMPKLSETFERMIAREPSQRPSASELIFVIDQLFTLMQRRSQPSQKRQNHRFELSTDFGLFPQANHHGEMNQVNYLHSLVYQVKLDARHIQVSRVNLPQSKRIKEIAKGKSHYLVLTYDDIVYGWGSKTHGQLGACGLTHQTGQVASMTSMTATTSAASNKSRFTRSARNSINKKDVRQVAPTQSSWNKAASSSQAQSNPSSLASSTQTIIMSPQIMSQKQHQHHTSATSTKVNSLQITRQLVIGMLKESQPAKKPFVINELNHRKIVQVAAGNNFSVFLTKTGVVMTCGDGASACLGRGEVSDTCFTPCMVDSLLNMDVACISSGPNHVVAVCGNGQVFAWGRSSYGRLGVGLGQPSYVLKPQLCQFPDGVVIKSSFCGDRCTIFIDSNRKSWACGENRYNKLGLDVKRRFKKTLIVDKCWTPTEIRALDSHEVVSCNLGKNHTSFVTTEGKLIVFGQDIDHGYRLEKNIIDARKSHRRISFELQTQRRPRQRKDSFQAHDQVESPYYGFNYERLAQSAIEANLVPGFKYKAYDLNSRNNIDLNRTTRQFKLDKALQKQVELYVKKSRAIKKMPFEYVIGVSCMPKFTLALTSDNRVYFWGTRSYRRNQQPNSEEAASSYMPQDFRHRRSIEPQLINSQSDDCFVKIGETNNSLMSSIQKLGSDQPIMHAQDPRLKANSLADLWILDYEPTSRSESSSTSSNESLANDVHSSSCCSSCECLCQDFGEMNLASTIDADEGDLPMKHDAILEPQPIISLYVPSMFNHAGCSLHLADLFCFEEDKFYLILDTTFKLQQSHHPYLPQTHNLRNHQNQTGAHLQPSGNYCDSRHTSSAVASAMTSPRLNSRLPREYKNDQILGESCLRTRRLGSLSSDVRLARENNDAVEKIDGRTVDPFVGQANSQGSHGSNFRNPDAHSFQDDNDELETVIEKNSHYSDDMINNGDQNVSESNKGHLLEDEDLISDNNMAPLSTSHFGMSSLEEPRSFSTFANALDDQIIIGSSMRIHDQQMQPLDFETPPSSAGGNQLEHDYMANSNERQPRVRLLTNKSESTTNCTGADQDETSSMPSWVRNEFIEYQGDRISDECDSNSCEIEPVDHDENTADDGELTFVSDNNPSEPSLPSTSGRLERDETGVGVEPASGGEDLGSDRCSVSSCSEVFADSCSLGGADNRTGESKLEPIVALNRKRLMHSLSEPDISGSPHDSRPDYELSIIRRNSMIPDDEEEQANLLDCKVYRANGCQQTDNSLASNLCIESRAGSRSLLIDAATSRSGSEVSRIVQPQPALINSSLTRANQLIGPERRVLSQSNQQLACSGQMRKQKMKTQSTTSLGAIRKSLVKLFC